MLGRRGKHGQHHTGLLRVFPSSSKGTGGWVLWNGSEGQSLRGIASHLFWTAEHGSNPHQFEGSHATDRHSCASASNLSRGVCVCLLLLKAVTQQRGGVALSQRTQQSQTWETIKSFGDPVDLRKDWEHVLDRHDNEIEVSRQFSFAGGRFLRGRGAGKRGLKRPCSVMLVSPCSVEGGICLPTCVSSVCSTQRLVPRSTQDVWCTAVFEIRLSFVGIGAVSFLSERSTLNDVNGLRFLGSPDRAVVTGAREVFWPHEALR